MADGIKHKILCGTSIQCGKCGKSSNYCGTKLPGDREPCHHCDEVATLEWGNDDHHLFDGLEYDYDRILADAMSRELALHGLVAPGIPDEDAESDKFYRLAREFVAEHFDRLASAIHEECLVIRGRK